jgi:hypothetical protein
MADKQTDTETRERYLSAANRHDPHDPRSAASVAAPDQPAAGVVSPVAVERGQNLAGGVSELDYEPPADVDSPRGEGFDALGAPLPAASSKSDPGNADADTGYKAEALGTVKERTDRDELPAPGGAVVEGGVARPADTDSSSKADSKASSAKSSTGSSSSKG